MSTSPNERQRKVAEIRHELIPARINEIDELQLKDRSLAIGGEAARHAEDGRFRQRRIENLIFGNSVESFCVRRKTPPLGSSMSSPKIIRPESFVRPSTKRVVDHIADAVLARWQNLARSSSGDSPVDLDFQFVRRWIVRRVPPSLNSFRMRSFTS